MRFRNRYHTEGQFKEQDATFVRFEDGDDRHERFFADIMLVLCECNSDLSIVPDELDRAYWVNRHLTAADLNALTDGCLPERADSGPTYNSKYI